MFSQEIPCIHEQTLLLSWKEKDVEVVLLFLIKKVFWDREICNFLYAN